MTHSTQFSQQIEDHIINSLKSEDPDAQVKIKPTSLGWLKLRVITHLFKNQSLEWREQKVDSFLEAINTNLGQYPIAGYELLTPKEATKDSSDYIQLPLWSDILMAPESDQPIQIDEDSPKRPLIVTFYSFKGGVGRSTDLGLVASILARRNRRVVMVDFDLEAPGISIMFRSDTETFNAETYRLRTERSPIDEERLAEIWKVEDNELTETIRDMREAGILTERSRANDPPPRVYAVAELYLYGLNMVRKGQR